MLAPLRVDEQFVRLAQQSGAVGGHHNQNFVQPLTTPMAQLVGGTPGDPVLVRVPRTDAASVVVRTWQDESTLLRSLESHLPHAPRLLATTSTATVLSYVEGIPLSHLCASGSPLPDQRVLDLVELLTQTMTVRRTALPELPDGWPHGDRDSQGFLRALMHLADRQIRESNWPTYGSLFTRLGVPEDVLKRMTESVPRMANRPFSLLHSDLHLDNVIVTTHGFPSLIAVDWELATFGDPLYDLATHLVRTRYPVSQYAFVVEAWLKAVEPISQDAVKGLETDLKHYIDFERAQSVFPDVIRAARRLSHQGGTESAHLEEAVSTVQGSLQAGAAALGLHPVPDSATVRDALLEWQAASRPTSGTVPVDNSADLSDHSAVALSH